MGSTDLAVGGYALIATSALINSLDSAPPHLIIGQNTLPNASNFAGGAAIALVIGGPEVANPVVLDSVHYENDVDSVGGLEVWAPEGGHAPADSGAKSLSRCPNGSDSDNNAEDFSLTSNRTLGGPNNCSSLSPVDDSKD